MKKRGLFIGVLALLCVLMAAWALRRPVSGAVTPEGLRANLESAYAKLGNECWHVQEDLSAVLTLDAWEMEKGQPAGEPGLVLQLAECYLLEFYPDDRAVAYYGYASSLEQNYQTYRVPDGTEEALTAWVLEHGARKRDSAASFRR